ncbi:hypothetical protein FACS1894127_7800 [Clostridia bacterium]|nr:hypothetical protein FACS1894127_7800 [Clostridia bacterium]
MFASGLARLPEDSAGRFLQLATICHSRRLANPDRLCNRISGQLRHFDRKSAAFNRETLVGDLCALYSLCDHIEKEGGTPATVGVFRDTYQPVGSMEIWGLGAYGWHSTGGYTGVTTLFFSLKQNRILRFTAAMPNSVSPGADKLYNSGAPWGMNIKLSSLSHSRVSIKGAKLNASGQLSSTESCNAEALSNVDINNPVLAKLRFEDFRLLADALWVHLESQNEGTGTILTVLITPDRLDKGTFDRVSQTFHMPLYDREGRNLNISVKFQESTRLLLTNLALLDNEFETWGYGMFLVNVYIDNGKLTAFPITHFGRKIRNLSLDAEAVNNKGNHKFDWDLL